MAQYYQLVGQDQPIQTVTIEELRQYYPNITCLESAAGVQYVINNQDESATQFQSQQIQQIVLNTDTSQQIIVDQSQTNYQQQNQPYVVQENDMVSEYTQVNSQQQIYYTAPKTHILQSPQPPIVTQQLTNPHIINSPTGIRQMVPQQINNAHLLPQRRVAITPAPNRALPQNLGVRVQFAPPHQQEQVVEPPQRQTQQVSNVQNDNQFVVNDGRVIAMGQIKLELGQNQQENVQQTLVTNQPVLKKPKRNVRRLSTRGGGGGTRGRGYSAQQHPQPTLSISSKPVLQYAGKVRSPAIQPQPQQFPPRSQTLIPLSPQTQNGQSPAFPVTNLPPQQQFVDDSGGGGAPDEYKDSARMLVCLENGEQRLITFTLPKESCTVQDLLEQVGVPFNADTKIECIANPGSEIDYIVNVGAVNNPTFPIDAQQVLTVENLSESQDSSAVSQSEPAAPKSPEQAPEPPKPQPKFIPGFLAVCNHCGYVSEDFNHCLRCKTKLPDDVKTISSKSNAKQNDEKKSNGKIELPKSQINKAALLPAVTNAQGAKPPGKSPRGRKPKAQDLEPVVLTLSSDDEETPSKLTIAGVLNRLLDNSVTLSAIQKEPVIPEDCNSDIEHEFEEGIYGGGRDEELKLNIPIHSTTLPCRTIRIGSYRFVPREEICISSLGVKMFVPILNDQTQSYKLFIPMKYIIKVLGTFSKSLPVLFFYVTPSIASLIRKNIKMDESSDCYFDPLSKEDPFKRITFLPEVICEETKQKIKDIFLGTPYKMLEELSAKEANDILIRTCPREGGQLKVIPPQVLSFSEVRQLVIYPPGKGGIAINTEDYLCLAQDQFLNDVIIDFYLKYLVTDVLASPMKNKVYIFSSFFYKRLTTKPAKASKRSNPYEVDPNLSPAEKRHCRVKSWTKNVNIFEKDYIIIPINENSHWFLAIICFPGLEGCRSMKDSNKIVKIPAKQKKKVSITIGNTTITTLKTTEDKSSIKSIEKPIKCDDEEGSDRDEAEGDESELEESENESENDENFDKKTTQREPIKQPCILIFDSLAGASRSRVVATLRDYLTCEHRTKLNSTKTFNKDNIKGACPKVPQQMNFTDCGLYVLQYVESFFKDPITDYHIPIKLLKNWFEEIIVTRKREEISNLIRELMRENDKDPSILPDITFPTLNGELISNVEAHFSEAEEEGELEDEEEEEPAKIENSLQQLQTMYNSDSSAESPAKETSSPPISTSDFVVSNVESGSMKPDLSEYSRKSNRETMSYLKSKRIIRHRNQDANEVKKQKVD